VADDVVEIWRDDAGTVTGRGPARIRHHMEIRGLGIINIQDLFGVAAIRERKRIELVIQLEAWQPDKEYDRLGLTEYTLPLLGIEIPVLRVPVSAGRNVAILVEVAARNHLLKRMGIHAARAFAGRIPPREDGAPVEGALDPEREDVA
jgi:HPr kinase/phosphorylase